MKYFRTFLLGIQREFQYRANLLGWLIVGAVPSLVMIFVWFAILGNNTSLNGFTKSDFIVYYFFLTIGWYIVGGFFGVWIADDILNGRVNVSLLKPYDIFLGMAIQEQAWKVLSIILTLPVLIVAFFFLRSFIHIHLSVSDGIVLGVSLLLGALNFACIEGIVGLSAFWVTHIWPVSHISDILQLLFGGRFIPILLMPLWLQNLANVLPFKYQFYTPVTILLHKSANPLQDVFVQALFVVGLYVLYRIILSFGIRKYEAYGG